MGRPRKADPATGSRKQLERYLWEATEWRGDADLIDRILGVVDQYVAARTALLSGQQPEPVPEPEPEQAAGQLSADDWAAVVAGVLDEDGPPPGPVTAPGSLEDMVHHMVDVVLAENGKKCRDCETPKPFECFSRDSKAKDGRRHVCKICDTKRKRNWETAARAAGTYRTGRRRAAGVPVPGQPVDAAGRTHEAAPDRPADSLLPPF